MQLGAAAERAARQLGGTRIVLQTADRQPAAPRLYGQAGHTLIPIFARHEALLHSNWFETVLEPAREATG